MTLGSSTVTMETTSNADIQRHALKSVATENLDPSQTGTPRSPTPTGIPSEKKARPRVGRNLLGAAQSSSPLSPRYRYNKHLVF